MNLQHPFSFGASALPMPQQPLAQGGQQDVWALIAQLLGQQAPAPVNNVPTNLAALRNDPQGDANKAYVPGQAGPANPFSNGTFLTAPERAAREQAVLGHPGMTGVQMGQAPAQPPPAFAAPMQAPMSGQMPNRAAESPFAMMDTGGFTGPMTPQNDAAAAAEYLRQAKPGGLAKYRKPY